MEIAACHRAELRHARHAEILRTLCSIVAELLDSQFDHSECPQCLGAGQGDVQPIRDLIMVREDLSLPMILAEFKLSPRQVLMLRRRGGFPTPYRDRHRLMFRRSEVETWIARQPNRSRPIDILKRPIGAPIRRIGTQQTARLVNG